MTGSSPQSVLGVDPGISGALVFFCPGRGEITVFDAPTVAIVRHKKTRHEIDPAALAAILRPRAELHDIVAVVERVGAMPKQGTASMFSFGRSLGMVEGALAALGIPVHYVTPRIWQKAMVVPAGDDGSRLRASQLLPAYASQWSRKKDHGRADAALIALYGALHVLPAQPALVAA